MSSQIKNLFITTVSSNSILQIGDSCIIDSKAQVIAVQRQEEQFYGNEAPFSMYNLFNRAAAAPLSFPNHCLKQSSVNTVDLFTLRGIANSSVLHVGDSQHIRMVSRVKHIRQLNESATTKE
ncbi:spore germination protein GerPE [Jeotgalibacillus campisalis]|uniref:spore germination protein GerPE n=1 Tax=Jeotgalibacillus campisalis TaxID=220754 RepID=UPI000596B576|nr:spore germination protein GerPE [Jeotgalibacillus campisalis]